MMKKTVLGVSVALGLALAPMPVANAITCDELNAQIDAHNANPPGDYATDGQIAAYNAEAERQNSTPCV
jgi:hypothetical protein